VIQQRLLVAGLRFRYPGIEEALGSIVLDGSGTRKSSLAGEKR
jgi:hypothetical protein